MYHQHFGMHTDPFPLSPKLIFVYPSRAFGETMAHLVYGIEQAEDIVLITGGIGMGKTLAVHSLLAQISRVLEPVLVNVTRLSFPELLKYVLLELGQNVPGQPDVPDLLHHLKRVLREKRKEGRKVLLIVDEAQHLDASILENLRLLMNLSTPEDQLLQLILVGQPGLEDTIRRPDLAQLNQRIRVRYRLEALSRQEVEAYVNHRVRIAGCDRNLFKSAALDRIYALSEGIPRVVNILASRALLAAFIEQKSQVEAAHVRAEDLPPVSELAPERALPAAPRRAVEPAPEPAAAAPPPAAAPAPRIARPRIDLRPVVVGVTVVVVALLVLWQLPRLRALTPTQAGRTEVAAQPPAAVQAAPAPAAPAVRIHVASFHDVQHADRLVTELAAAGQPAFRTAALVSGEPWVRVFVGPYTDPGAAEQARVHLIQSGLVAYARLLTATE